MKVIKVRVSVGVTINLGNFESLKIAYDAEAVLDPNDGTDASMDVLRHALTEKIRADLADSEGGKKYLMKKYEDMVSTDVPDYDDDIPF